MQTITVRITIVISFFLNIITTIYGSQIIDQTTRNPIIRAAAQEYNKYIPLIALPKEVLLSGMIDVTQPLKRSIKNSLSLSATCTHFNGLLPYLGFLHTCYSDEEKNKMLRYIKEAISNEDLSESLYLWGRPVPEVYWQHRRMTLLLIHAAKLPVLGSEGKSVLLCDLRGHACFHNDVEMVKAMLEKEANLGKFVKWVRTKKVALIVDEFCGKHDIDFQKILEQNPDILFSYIYNSSNVELLQFYLDRGIELRKNKRYGDSILHCMAHISQRDSNRHKQAELLLTTIPDMVNELNDNGETPLDLMFSLVHIPFPFFGPKYIASSSLIELFRHYGAKRSDELEEDKQPCLMLKKSPEKIGWLTHSRLFWLLPSSVVIVAGLLLWKR